MSRITKRNLSIVIALVVILGVGVYLWRQHMAKPPAQTTSKSKTAQYNYTGATTHQSNATSTPNQGGAVDNHGDKSATSAESGIASASGLITVVSPGGSASLASGDMLRGTADKSITTIQYRVIDDEVGVIAQGSLQVVNSTYSGTLHFEAHGATGRVDVYSYNDQSQEVNEIQLPVQLVK